MSVDIVSPSNDRIKRLIRLRDRKHRDSEAVFVVEGPRELTRALDAGLRPREMYQQRPPTTPLAGTVHFTCSPEALAKASYRSAGDAVIAVFDRHETTLDQIVLRPSPLVLLAEGVEKPGNLGAILRSADAFAADAVVAVDSRIDLFNPNVIRSSTGAVFTVPCVAADLTSTSEWLRANGLWLVAASPGGRSQIWDLDLSGPVALLVGAEDTGLTRGAEEAADVLVRIPMNGAVDSLNASVTMAILAYEAVRQRAKRPSASSRSFFDADE